MDEQEILYIVTNLITRRSLFSPRTKYELDRMNRCRDTAVRNFPKREVGRRSILQYIHCCHVYITLRYVRNVACEE